MAYEFCLLFGIVFIAGYLLLTLTHWRWPLGEPRLSIFQAAMFVAIGAYFVYFWRRSGQTLAMKTWRIRLVTADGAPLGPARAWLRYVLLWWGLLPSALVLTLFRHPVAAAWTFFVCSVLSTLWMTVDRDRQFLHDRLIGTRLVTA